MSRAKMVSVRSVNAALRQAGVEGGVRSRVLDTVRGEDRLPTISKSHVKQLKLDLKEHGIAALSLSGSGKVRMVLDTDTYNEIDDQFAIVYALSSSDRLDVEAIYAAPFLSSRSKSTKDGMEKSYQEILKLLW